MTVEIAVVAIWLYGLMPFIGNESENEHFMRAWSYAIPIVKVVDRYDCDTGAKPCWRGTRLEAIAALGTQGRFESAFDPRIQRGECEPGECDELRQKDGRIIFKAQSFWQLHMVTDRAVDNWYSMLGDDQDSIEDAADAALFHLSINRCKGNYPGMFSAMSGKGCGVTEKGSRRAAWFQRKLWILRGMYERQGI